MLLAAAGGVRVGPPPLGRALPHDREAQQIDLQRGEDALRGDAVRRALQTSAADRELEPPRRAHVSTPWSGQSPYVAVAPRAPQRRPRRGRRPSLPRAKPPVATRAPRRRGPSRGRRSVGPAEEDAEDEGLQRRAADAERVRERPGDVARRRRPARAAPSRRRRPRATSSRRPGRRRPTASERERGAGENAGARRAARHGGAWLPRAPHESPAGLSRKSRAQSGAGLHAGR